MKSQQQNQRAAAPRQAQQTNNAKQDGVQRSEQLKQSKSTAS
jgi:hypothetical protein